LILYIILEVRDYMYAYYYGEIVRRYKVHCTTKAFWTSSTLSLITFIGVLVINSLLTEYATLRASNPVTDIILSNTPAFDVDVYFVYGAAVLVLFVAFVLLSNPKQ